VINSYQLGNCTLYSKTKLQKNLFKIQWKFELENITDYFWPSLEKCTVTVTVIIIIIITTTTTTTIIIIIIILYLYSTISL